MNRRVITAAIGELYRAEPKFAEPSAWHRAYHNRAEPLWRSFGAAVLFFAGAAMLVGMLGLAK